MNPKKILRKVAPRKAIKTAEEAYRKSRVAGVHLATGLPTRGQRVIAITGSNGKTSTANFLNDALKSLGFRTAMFTTAVIEMDGERTLNTNHTTVPKTQELFRFLKLARTHKVDFVILEVTSHALHQHKVWGIPVEVAVMTNISQDHLDYHGTMENYATAKARLFSRYMKPVHSVLNIDDDWYDFFLKQNSGRLHTYGRSKEADTTIASIKQGADGLSLRLDGTKGSIIATTGVIGTFNAYNIAAVASVLELLDISPDKIRVGLEHISSVPGRMELIRSSRGFTAVVDYAHTPDALEKALTALHDSTNGKVSVVFGATGDRDKTKRPIMGEVVAKFADKIYLTDDETYSENGEEIRKSVLEGIKSAREMLKCIEIADRREAIKLALMNAEKGEMVLIAGLGHQNYRAMNEGNIPWQESEVVTELLKELGLE